MQVKYILVLHQDIQGAFSQFCSNFSFFLGGGSYFFLSGCSIYHTGHQEPPKKPQLLKTKGKAFQKTSRMMGRKEIKLLQGFLGRSAIFQSLDSSPKSQSQIQKRTQVWWCYISIRPLPDVGLRMGFMNSMWGLNLSQVEWDGWYPREFLQPVQGVVWQQGKLGNLKNIPGPCFPEEHRVTGRG